MIAEYDTAGTQIARYVYGPGIDEPISMTRGTETYYYHFDGLGSVIGLTDSSGTKVEEYSYDIFGKADKVSTVNNPYMFTGRRFDPETGLYYYRARMYSTTLGRFLQTDPIGYFDSMNLYQYCGNNPVNFVDPLGLCGENADDRPWWNKLGDGYYYGTGFGEEAVDYWAQKYVDTDNFVYAVAGGFSSLWTRNTYKVTTATIVAGTLISKWASATGPAITYKGGEIVYSNSNGKALLRINPMGHKNTTDKIPRLPHYHRRIVDPKTGNTKSGGGIGKHRPWEGGW